jgi:hypothetical protein
MRLQKLFTTLGIAAMTLGSFLSVGGCAMQRHFGTPGDAVGSLVEAFRDGDKAELRQILGQDGEALLSSGDPVDDEATARRFLAAYDQKHQLIALDEARVRLDVGDDDWPMPIPVVKDMLNQWRFDTDAGKDELLSRRIGRNELNTMQVCLAIVDAQREYAALDPERVGLPVYAEKIYSDPGRKNGLYWETAADEPPSPIGPLAADAAAEGYSRPGPARESAGPRPYHGYCFKLLKAQGPYARGGTRDYMVRGRLIGGFALVAWPATYGNSGIMTFIVNQDGVVYQRDFGPDTPQAVARLASFNPDPQWTQADPGELSENTTARE